MFEDFPIPPDYYCSIFRLSHLVFLNCFSEMLFSSCALKTKQKQKSPPHVPPGSHSSFSCHWAPNMQPANLSRTALSGDLRPAGVVGLVVPDCSQLYKSLIAQELQNSIASSQIFFSLILTPNSLSSAEGIFGSHSTIYGMDIFLSKICSIFYHVFTTGKNYLPSSI